MAQHILRIDCPDEPGLVHKITGVVFNAGYNILSNQEFVDLEAKHFFMRTAFEGPTAPDRVVSYLEQILPGEATVKLTGAERQPIVIMATAEAHCLGDLLIRHYSGELPATIRAVVSNHEKLKALVEQFGIPFHWVSHENSSAPLMKTGLPKWLRIMRRNTSCSPNTCVFSRRSSWRAIPIG